MKLQQLRYVVEVYRRNLNVSDAAEALFTSQPGVSKQIKLLEEELGVVIFERSAKRFTGVTEPGKVVIETAQRMLKEAENLKRVGEDYAGGDSGRLAIAATHTQARYALPEAVKDFVGRFPKVRLHLHQGSPTQIAEWLISGEADIAVATEALDQYPEIVALPCRPWSHSVVAPVGHPVLQKPLTLQQLARWPLVTYDTAFAGRSKINRAFERAGLVPNVTLAAIDADVIKTYVGLGLGLGIIADMAFDADRDHGLVAIDGSHLFESNTTKIGLRRQTHLRRFEFAFIELFAPHLSRRVVEAAMASPAESAADQGLDGI
jgi:LysR family cys regulon transcriptional activator